MSTHNICKKPSCSDCPLIPRDCNCPPKKTIEYQECPHITNSPRPSPTPIPTCPPAKVCTPCIKSCPKPNCRENFENYNTSYFVRHSLYKDGEDTSPVCHDCLKPVACPAEDCSKCPPRYEPCLCDTTPIRKLNNSNCPTPRVYPPTPPPPKVICPKETECPPCELDCPAVTCPPKPTPCPTPAPSPRPTLRQVAPIPPLQSKYCGKYINTGCNSGETDYQTSELLVDAEIDMPSSNCASGYVPGMYSLIEDRGIPLIAKGSTYNCPGNNGDCHQPIPNVWSGVCQCKPKSIVDTGSAYDPKQSESGDLIYIRCGGESDVSIPGGEGNFEWWGKPVINSNHFPNSKYPPGAIPPRSKSYSCAELCEKNYYEELSDEAHHEYYIPGIDKIVRLDSRHLD